MCIPEVEASDKSPSMSSINRVTEGKRGDTFVAFWVSVSEKTLSTCVVSAVIGYDVSPSESAKKSSIDAYALAFQPGQSYLLL